MNSPSVALNFPQTFLPDRRYLAILLAQVKAGLAGTKEEISQKTGIPTGQNTGKVLPMLFYAYCSDLIALEKAGTTFDTKLTPLGELVSKEDPYFKADFTLLLIHLKLSQANIVPRAVAWHYLFARLKREIGVKFTVQDYCEGLEKDFGKLNYIRPLCRLVCRSYEKQNFFGPTALVSATENAEHYCHERMPSDNEYWPLYTYFIYSQWEQHFFENQQLEWLEFDRVTYFSTLLSWPYEHVLNFLQKRAASGWFQLDLMSGAPVIARRRNLEDALCALYSELI